MSRPESLETWRIRDGFTPRVHNIEQAGSPPRPPRPKDGYPAEPRRSIRTPGASSIKAPVHGRVGCRSRTGPLGPALRAIMDRVDEIGERARVRKRKSAAQHPGKVFTSLERRFFR